MPEIRRRVMHPDTVLPMSYNAAAMDNPGGGRVVGVPYDYDWRQFDFEDPTNFEEFWQTYSMRKGGNWFMTGSARRRIEDRLTLSTDPIDLITIVCPPYSKYSLRTRENKGLMTNFDENPVDHNFEYDYKVITHCHVETLRFLQSQGIQANAHMIIGDWALRGASGVRTQFPTDSDIIGALDTFAASADNYMRRVYPDTPVHIDRFLNTSIKDEFPLDIPQDPAEKRDHMLEVMQWDDSRLLHTLQPIIAEVLQGTANLASFTNPESWSSLGDRAGDNKQTLIHFLQVFRNTAESRKTELGKNIDPYEAGFWDALLKSWEYEKYARIFKARYPNSVKAFYDTKYPASGLFFEEGGLDLMYLDPRRFYIPMSELRIPFNPF